MASNSTFTRPPEAPIYYPTEEEFSSPLLYIQSIKDEAEKFGMCKVVPPKSFKPPFAVNKDTFRFKARYQRLSDLDAFSRSRHSFACMLRRFWTDQGWPAELGLQTVGEQVIDWYDLYIAVHRLGGFKAVCAMTDGWTHVARCLNIHVDSHPAATKELRIIYEKNLLPYDEFRAQVESILGKDHATESLRKNPPVNKSAGCRRMDKKSDGQDEIAPPSKLDTCMLNRPEQPKTPPSEASTSNGLSTPAKGSETPENKKDEKRERARRSTSKVCYSEMDCEVCKQSVDFENLKFCEKCETTYHLRCIPTPIKKDKTKLWLCPRCMKETYDGLRSCHTFGFDTSSSLYTLDEFSKKADLFKRNHFGSTNVGLQTVEAEFWRLLGDPHGETVVEYGADLHRGELGSSGFPTEIDRPFLRESEKEYIDHPWNLNKLPDNELSILKHITAQISGMKIPWMYVGMCFSAFCWHTEDHWSASINYLHMGDPKTWYGVPGSAAETFETAFKQLVPILMESNPDLLHQLVTHMNPTVLQACGVPIYRTDQRAGEFIVTFPRAYHAGFNQGFNFAEAVNFCLADWIPHGRLSINHYSNCKRELVFSHDELICCMSDQAHQLHQTIARACHKDFLHMVEDEAASRQRLEKVGITLDDEPTLFEFMDDHERSCSTCHTTLFLSAVQCMCSNEKLACGKHAEQLCHCAMSSRRLLYRYTIDDLNKLLNKLLIRSEEPETVETKPTFSGAIGIAAKRTAQLADGRNGKRQKLSAQDSSPMDFFGDHEGSSTELKAVMKMASELVSPQTITRGRDAGDISPAVRRWSLTDVEGLVVSLLAFPGTSKEVSHVREYLRKYYALENEIRLILQNAPEEQEYETVRRVFDQARSTNIHIENLDELQSIVIQTEFREKVSAVINDPRTTIESLAEVLPSPDEMLIRSTFINELIASIMRLIDEGRNMEIDAENIITHGRRVTLEEVKALIERADSFPVELKNVDLIRDGLDTVEKLVELLESRTVREDTKGQEQRIHMHDLKAILGTEDVMNIHGGSVGVILEIYGKANQFLDKLHKLFFGSVENDLNGAPTLTLLDVLSPRQVHIARHAGEIDGHDTDTDGESSSSNEGSPEKRQPSLQPEMGDTLETDIKRHPFDLDLEEHYDVNELKGLFERACWDEQMFYERLRESNCLKSALDSDIREESAQLRKELRWCVCGGMQLGTMIQCDSCFDWFHVSCTRMADFICDDGIGEFGLVRQLVESIQFMCDICQRGIRPPLESVKKLYLEYKDIQRFVVVPEMDLASFVITRAEKWRRSAANVITELPAIVHQINAIADREAALRIRRRTRDAVLALLLEGNLLEVKLPEWLFLYDFVHENFRKDRHEEDATGPMILPVRTHGRFPIAIDVISPIFRLLSKNSSKPLTCNVEPVDVPAEELNGSADVKVKNGRSDMRLGGRKKGGWNQKAHFEKSMEALSSVAEPIRRNGKRRNGDTTNAFIAGLNKLPNRNRPVGVPPSTNGVSNGLAEQEDAALETCHSCRGSFSADQMPSTIIDGRVVAMCVNCKNSSSSNQFDQNARNGDAGQSPPSTRSSPRRNRTRGS